MLPRRSWQAQRHLAGVTAQGDVIVRLREQPHTEAAHGALRQIGRSFNQLIRPTLRVHRRRTLADEMLRGVG